MIDLVNELLATTNKQMILERECAIKEQMQLIPTHKWGRIQIEERAVSPEFFLNEGVVTIIAPGPKVVLVKPKGLRNRVKARRLKKSLVAEWPALCERCWQHKRSKGVSNV